MAKLHELRLKINSFSNNIDVNVAQSIENVSNDIVVLNKQQMLSSQDSENKSLIHAKTGSPNLSPAYARRTGKRTPNLYLDGTFQGDMFLSVNENNKTWFIDSLWDKTKYLVENYGAKIFGINDNNKVKAKELTSRSFKKLFESKVFGR